MSKTLPRQIQLGIFGSAALAFAACSASKPAPAPPAQSTPIEAAPPEPEPAPEPEPDPLPVSPEGVTITPCPDTVVPNMVCVTGGPFTRGADTDHSCDQYEIKWSRSNASPSATVWVSSFYLDQTEVTYKAYQACVAAGSCKARQPNYLDFRRDDLPMTGVNWFEAAEFCAAHGKRLPTEAEFERAARGAEGALHPWGDAPATCDRAVIMDDSGRGCGTPKKGSHPEKGRPVAVGSRPLQGKFHDLIGNAEEWVADWYAPYADCGTDCAGTDPQGPCADDPAACSRSKTKLVKGGSWYWNADCATGTNRRHHFPKNQPYHHFGFRCAATVDQAKALSPVPGGGAP